MRTGTLDLTLRPIKLAFIVEVLDTNAILDAIRINSALWGGIFNPIIPFFERKPKILSRDVLFKREKNENLIKGYLNTYDPDFVIQLGKCSDKSIDIGGREKITRADVLADFKKEGTIGYGVGIFELLNYFYGKELKFLRKKPLKIVKPRIPSRKHLFFSSVFGEIPEEMDDILLTNYQEPFNIQTPLCNLNNFHKLLSKDTLFLRRFTSMYIDVLGRSHRFDDNLLFLMDPNSSIDIIDYWNLRALGTRIIPIPKQVSNTEEIKEFSLNFIDESFGQSRYNPRIYYTATVQKGRSINEADVQSFLKYLDVKPDKESKEAKITARFWYPRIWDEWARDKDGAEMSELESETSQKDLSGELSNINFKTITPKFASKYGWHGKPRFANEIKLRVYGDKDVVAEVMPRGNSKLANTIGGYGYREWRLSNKGLVYLSEHSNWTVHLPLPEAELVFLNWLKSLDWKVKISPSGFVGKQLIKHLGGIWGIGSIANKELLSLIGRLTGQNRTLATLSTKIEVLENFLKERSYEDISKKMADFLAELEDAKMSAELKQGPILHKNLIDEISKAISKDRFKKDPKKYLERLIEVNMFRLGVQIQCPVCQKNSWYGLNELKYELQCPKCLENFPPPTHSPNNDMQWAYRPFGPFSLPNLALGNYSVLLTLRFFSKLLDAAVTPSMSFILKKGAREFEIDLGLLFSWSTFNPSTVIPVFCECKSFWDKFDEKDIKNLEYLGQQVFGAVLVFATFRNSLDRTEKSLLTAFVKKNRKNRKIRKQYNQILILTGTELFAEFGPPECWKDGTEQQKKQAKYDRYLGMDGLCDATQEIYLGLKTYSEEEMERFEAWRLKKVSR